MVTGGVDGDRIALGILSSEDSRGDWVLNPLLDYSFERPGAELWLVPFACEAFYRRVGYVKTKASLTQPSAKKTKLN